MHTKNTCGAWIPADLATDGTDSRILSRSGRGNEAGFGVLFKPGLLTSSATRQITGFGPNPSVPIRAISGQKNWEGSNFSPFPKGSYRVILCLFVTKNSEVRRDGTGVSDPGYSRSAARLPNCIRGKFRGMRQLRVCGARRRGPLCWFLLSCLPAPHVPPEITTAWRPCSPRWRRWGRSRSTPTCTKSMGEDPAGAARLAVCRAADAHRLPGAVRRHDALARRDFRRGRAAARDPLGLRAVPGWRRWRARSRRALRCCCSSACCKG